MQIKNATALISGAASGMGAATARHLATLGAKVIMLDINEGPGKQLAKEISGQFFLCDITDPISTSHIIQTLVETAGPPQIAVNCAGIISAERLVSKQGPMPLEAFQKIITVNLIGNFNVMRLIAAAMIQQPLKSAEERGVIINTASIAAFEGQIGQVAYSASKGGIISMTLPAARELAQFGIRVMAIAPGLVNTPMFEKIPPEAKEALAATVPFPKRLAYPEEYASLVQHIIENPMLNGSCIRLDGALRMQPK